MKRMEVPRLPLHNLQGGTGIAPAEAVKPSKHTEILEAQEPLMSMPENQNEPSPPPSRILRSGKRVPIGTASKAPPRTASKASRVAVPASDDTTSAQASPTLSAVPTIAHAAQQTHPSSEPSNHSAGPHTTPAVKPPATFQAPLTEMLPVAPAATAGLATPPHAGVGSASSQLHSSQVLHDLQTSVSPVMVSQPQPAAHHTTPVPSLSPAEVTSPIALAPCSTEQPEAPTPTLLPRGSVSGLTDVSGSPAVEPAVEFAVESPRNMLSSLQQMNLQSKPFDFAGNPLNDVSVSAPKQTQEPVDHHDSSQTDTLGLMHEQTPEPFHHSAQEEATVDPTVEDSSEEQDRQLAETDAAQPEGTEAVGKHSKAEEEEEEALPAGYISRRTTDPYMQKKLRGIQQEEWTAADDTFKLHKSKLELAKEEAAAARSEQLSSADKAAVRRMVTSAFQRVVATGGQSLGESMVKHKSRLEREKEVAEQQRKAEEAAQAQRAKRKVVHTPGSWAKQGLGELGKHKSRLEKEKEAAAAVRKATGASPPVGGKLPSYMRPTSASKAMQKGLGEDITKPKSRLEREKEAATAAAAKAGSTSDVHKSTLNVRSKVAEAWQGQGLESVLHKRKSKLEQDKENAAAAAAAGNRSPKELNKPVAATRKSMGWGGQGLGDLKVHKSKLQKDKDAWAKAAAAEADAGTASTTASRKPLLKESNPASQKPDTSETKRVPSYMKSTHTSSTRSSLGSTPETDARFAF